jgi:hypothetical protein
MNEGAIGMKAKVQMPWGSNAWGFKENIVDQ